MDDRQPRGRGTIPARAGSTEGGRPRWDDPRDHPRASGEHLALGLPPDRDRGPSPRERGAPLRRLGRHGPRRTIPARAGSTCRRRQGCPARPDHPRASGEHPSGARDMARFGGPSPRERGALAHTPPVRHDSGTIPARAGSTSRPLAPVMGDGDHPRASGEHDRRHRGQQPRGRTIPARAGSTLLDQARYRWTAESYFTSRRRRSPWLTRSTAIERSTHAGRQRPRSRRAAWLQLRGALTEPSARTGVRDSSSLASPVDTDAPAARRSAASGRSISSSPSKSTGVQSWPWTRKASPCSFRAEWTRMARPRPIPCSILSHNRSLTRAETRPTNTPGAISNSQRVRTPLNDGGTAVRTTTVTSPPSRRAPRRRS